MVHSARVWRLPTSVASLGKTSWQRTVSSSIYDRFGTILHYRGLKIGQRIIINTNIIMAPTTELFVYAFGAKEAEPKQQTGSDPLEKYHNA